MGYIFKWLGVLICPIVLAWDADRDTFTAEFVLFWFFRIKFWKVVHISSTLFSTSSFFCFASFWINYIISCLTFLLLTSIRLRRVEVENMSLPYLWIWYLFCLIDFSSTLLNRCWLAWVGSYKMATCRSCDDWEGPVKLSLYIWVSSFSISS